MCFELKTVEKYDVLERGFLKQLETKALWKKVNVAADVDASWEKVKRMCLYSTDTAFTQHKRDQYSLQTKAQKTADKNIFERHVKLQDDSGRIRGSP